MMTLSVSCQAQANATAVRLPDGSIRVEFEGKSYRGLTGAQLDQWEVQSNTLKTCQENEKRFTDKIALADANTKIAEQQRDNERIRFAGAMALYEKERELRTEAMQFIPHGKVGGVGGKVLNFLDSGWGQATMKLFLPFAQAVKVFTQ